jgi:hypothetical protein
MVDGDSSSLATSLPVRTRMDEGMADRNEWPARCKMQDARLAMVCI